MVVRKGQVQIAVHVPAEVAEKFKELSARTRVPQAAYFREALDDLLKKYAPGKPTDKSKRDSE